MSRILRGYSREEHKSNSRVHQAPMQLDQLGLDVVLYAIHQTATAPMPSWRYMAAILRRCAAEHVTGEQARVDDALIASGLPPRYQTPRKSTIVDILG